MLAPCVNLRSAQSGLCLRDRGLCFTELGALDLRERFTALDPVALELERAAYGSPEARTDGCHVARIERDGPDDTNSRLERHALCLRERDGGALAIRGGEDDGATLE